MPGTEIWVFVYVLTFGGARVSDQFHSQVVCESVRGMVNASQHDEYGQRVSHTDPCVRLR